MRNCGSNKNTKPVFYMLIAITGQINTPIFTYMCQIKDKTGI